MARPDSHFDILIIGSGPNGLSAALLLAQNGLKVKVIEAMPSIGGGTRTKELIEPGYFHDICSAVHPTAVASPYLSSLPLDKYGLEWIHPTYPFTHPLQNDEGVVIERSLEATAKRMGVDSENYTNLFGPLVNRWDDLSNDIFGSLRKVNHPLSLMRFGWYSMFSAKLLARSFFKTKTAQAAFAGMAAHSILPLDKAFTASFGLVLGLTAHTVGWPIAKNGSQSITNAMAQYLSSLGGEIELNRKIQSLDELPSNIPIMFDLTPRQISEIVGPKFSTGTTKKLNNFAYGPGVFKIDYILSEQVPWTHKESRSAGTIHLGGTLDEITQSEKLIWQNKHSDNPYMIVSQPSVFDSTRTPNDKHTLWVYCHVPAGSTQDMTEIIESQIERHAPGFRDTIIGKSSMNTQDFEIYNPNYIGGDINGGAQHIKQLIARPLLKWDPYKLPLNHLYICSSSTPPGGGVHGMGGYNAAKSLLKNEFNINPTQQ